MPQTAEQIRQAAMALLAQAEQMEQPQPDPEPTREDYVSWVMSEVDQVKTTDEAWHLVVDSWDEFDGDETLTLVGALIAQIGDPRAQRDAQAVEARPMLMRQFLITLGYEPSVLSALPDHEVEQIVDEITNKADAQVQAVQTSANPWPAGTKAHASFAARLQPKNDAAAPPPADDTPPPRGMRRRRQGEPSRIQSAAVDADFDPDNPFAHLAAAQVQMAQPLKTAAPRKPSGHRIPEHLQQWKRDQAGRRVPINTPEAQ